MNNLRQRAVTGLVLVVAILTMTNLGSYSFTIMLLVINLIALFEFYRLVAVTKTAGVLGILMGTALILNIMLIFNQVMQWQTLLIHIVAVFVILINELYTHHLRPFQNLAYTFTGIFMITLPLCFFTAISFLPLGKGYHAQLVISYFLILWAGDTGAYLAGRYVGRRLLFKRISPHKTWEGSICGVISAMLTACVLSSYFLILSIRSWLIWSAVIAITGIYGDLFKSMLKRSYHVKDTGKILPGHGGILDRFDALLGSAPFAFSYLLLYAQFKA